MPPAVAQTGVSLGRQLFFFLFLLVPGYFAVRAYYWANVALENNDRVNRLVSMAVGGFLSLAAVAFWRELAPTVRIGPLAFLSPEWLVVDGALAVRTVSELTILESVNLIVSQITVAVLGGYFLGTAKYVWYDQRKQTHSRLEHPWTQLTDEIPNEPIVIVSNDGTHTRGRPIAVGSEEQDYDIMLVASGTDDDTTTAGLPPAGSTDDSPLARGAISYHQYDDISRVILPESVDITDNRTVLQRRHVLLVRSLVDDGLQSVVSRRAKSVVARIRLVLRRPLQRLLEFVSPEFDRSSDDDSEKDDTDDADDDGSGALRLSDSDE